MKVNLSQVLKHKNSRKDSRKDSREENLSYQYMLFKSWLDSVQPIISSPQTDGKLRINKNPNTTTTIDINYDPFIPSTKD